ncbi:MAG: hypothetical protein IKO05_09980 [Selenomonadaceae bacterium]|nr:hypothetical protein [Selenomonadaceae bacterium]MBQ3725469.1 hypothetical protein [Selenomonadaceae bacterium]MBR3499307.1 hypothetical protein [Selenomonadaceae bacterium]
MSLKDFSFKQLDKAAQLVVGKAKAEEKVPVGRGTCSTARSCTSYRK